MEILIKAAQLILSLSLLIVLHELGHFIPAKLFKTRVEKFYLFFDPYFSLFKRKKGETEYGIGWLPLGGYVKISGMIDESMDKEQMSLPPQPWEFRSKPTWQRLIIMIGGVTVNLILGILIYICVLSYYGEEFIASKDLNYGIATDSLARKVGFKDGDKIVSVDGIVIENFKKVPVQIIMEQAKTVQIIRDGEPLEININMSDIGKIIKNTADFISPRFPFQVAEFNSIKNGEQAGIKINDYIVALNGIPTPYFNDFRNEITKYKNKEVIVTVLRNGKNIDLKAKVTEKGFLGLVPTTLDKIFNVTKHDYTFVEAIPAGTKKAFTTLTDYIKQFKLIFNSEVKGYESLGGFITFGKVFSPTWDWLSFWNITAFFSIVLAVMNILPIPALDGGHVIFLLYEMITSRKPNEKFMEYAQTAGMVLLLGLLIFANGNDIMRLFK
jgi:regulator of sigma E protease